MEKRNQILQYALFPRKDVSLNTAMGLEYLNSVQLLSHVWLFATPWTAAHQASLSITNAQSLLKLTSFESVIPSNHLVLCCPLLLLPSIFPSIRVFSKESVLKTGIPFCLVYPHHVIQNYLPEVVLLILKPVFKSVSLCYPFLHKCISGIVEEMFHECSLWHTT